MAIAGNTRATLQNTYQKTIAAIGSKIFNGALGIKEIIRKTGDDMIVIPIKWPANTNSLLAGLYNPYFGTESAPRINTL